MISSTVNIAKVMKSTAVAEYVENDLLVRRLRQHRTDLVQGFAIGNPAPFETLLDNIRPPVLLDDIANATDRELARAACRENQRTVTQITFCAFFIPVSHRR